MPLASVFEHIPVQIYVLGFVLGLATVPFVLLSSKTSQAKTAWILVLLGWPLFGVFFYGVFGRQRLKRKVVGLRNASVAALGSVEERVLKARGRSESASQLAKDLVVEAMAVGSLPVYVGNSFELHPEGDGGFRRAGEVVDAAKHHIHVVTYIFRSDRTGHAVLDALVRAAKRGVQVRLVYDALGTYKTRGRFFQPLVEAGGRVESFLPIRPFNQMVRWNLRNHRKILVVDGHTAFTGGRNIGDEYARDPTWRDLQVEIRGPAVCGIQRLFIEDWYFATDELLDDDVYFDKACVAGDVPIQVLSTGPEEGIGSMEQVFFSAIAGARDRVDIVSPYFVPTEPLYAAIRSALMRGRRVRLLIGGKVDHYVTFWAGQAFLPALIRDGLEVWQHPGMMHSKAIAIDDQWATVGSANFDARSFRLNFEMNVAFPHVPSARRVREYVDAECKASRRLTLDDLKFNFGQRMVRSVAGLFAPIL